jgi:hypothetical protein
MGFWEGLSKAAESNEAQRNVENQRQDRKDERAEAKAREGVLDQRFQDQWANTLAEQEYRRGQDTLAIEREDKKIEDDRRIAGLATIAKSGSPPTRSDSNKTNTSDVANTQQSLNHYVTILAKKPGIKDQSILNLSQYGAGVVSQAIDMYDEISVLADKDGGTIDINEFLASASVTVTPGEPLDYEAIAKSLGMTQEDLDSPYTSTETWKDAVTSALTQAPLVSADFGMTYRPPMDTDEWIKQEAAANRALTSDISGRLFALQRGEALVDGDTVSELNAAKAGLEAGDASGAIALMRPETLSMYQGNERLLEAADRFGGAFAGVLTSQRDAQETEAKAVSDGFTAMFEKYDVTEADIPNFDTTIHDDFTIDRHLKENRTPFYRVDGVLLQNDNIVKPGDGPTNPDTPTMPVDNNTDPASVQTDEVFGDLSAAQSRNANRASADRGFDNTPPVESSNSVGSQGRQRGGGDGIENVPYPFQSTTPEAVAARPQKEDRRPTRTNPAIQEEDGQLLLDYLQDDSTPPEMIDAMSDEFEKTYGFQALRDLLATLN